jgi:hypothetical protein
MSDTHGNSGDDKKPPKKSSVGISESPCPKKMDAVDEILRKLKKKEKKK